jgi:hypothetical protein
MLDWKGLERKVSLDFSGSGIIYRKQLGRNLKERKKKERNRIADLFPYERENRLSCDVRLDPRTDEWMDGG